MQRGEVFELRAPRVTRGREQYGRRYAVVVQNDELLALSTVVVAPTSTRARPASFRPEIEVRGERTRVLVEQVTAIDPSLLGARTGVLAFEELRAVDDALVDLLGLA